MGKTRVTTTKKNYIYSLAYQVLLMIVPLITTPYVARVLGADGNGVYSFTTSNVTYFTLLGILGLNTYGQLEIAKVKEDAQKRSVTFGELLLARWITNAVSLLGFTMLVLCSTQYRYIYILQGILILANAIDMTWFFQGMEEFKGISIRNMAVKLLSVLLIFIFVKDRNDLYLYTIICNGATLLGNVCLFPMIKKYLVRPNKFTPDLKKHIKGAFVFFVPSIASVVMTSLDKTMIGVITKSEEENGYYGQAYKIETLCFTVFSSLNMVMRSRMAVLFSQGKKEEITQKLRQSIDFVLILVFPMSLGLMGIASDFVPWFYGPGYDKVVILLKIFSFWLIFKAISNCILEQYVMASGKQKVFNIIIWIGAMANFVLNLILIRFYQSVGAAMASVFAEVVILIAVLWYSREQMRPVLLLKQSIRYLLSACVMCLGVSLIGNVAQSNAFTTLVQMAFGGIIYISLLLFMKDKYIYTFLLKILKKIKRG